MEINNLPKSKQAFLLTKCVEFSNYLDANRGRWKQVHSIGCVLKSTAFAWDELRYKQNTKLRCIINHFRYLTRTRAVSFTVENFSYKGVLKGGSLKKHSVVEKEVSGINHRQQPFWMLFLVYMVDMKMIRVRGGRGRVGGEVLGGRSVARVGS